MSKSTSRRVDQYLAELDALGVLEPWQKEAVTRTLKRMRRAQRTGNRQEVRKTLDEMARVFLRVTIEIVEPDPGDRADD